MQLMVTLFNILLFHLSVNFFFKIIAQICKKVYTVNECTDLNTLQNIDMEKENEK